MKFSRKAAMLTASAGALVVLAAVVFVWSPGSDPRKPTVFSGPSYQEVCGMKPTARWESSPQQYSELSYVLSTLQLLEQEAGTPLGDKSCHDIQPVATTPLANKLCKTSGSFGVRWCSNHLPGHQTGIPDDSTGPYYTIDTPVMEAVSNQASPMREAGSLEAVMRAYADYLSYTLRGKAPTMAQKDCLVGAFTGLLGRKVPKNVSSALEEYMDWGKTLSGATATGELFSAGKRNPGSCLE